VKDNVSALLLLLEREVKNDIYNIASENFMTNLEVVNKIIEWEGKSENSIQFVENRWGQDLRYAVDSKKIRSLGWSPQHDKGLYKWY